MIFCGNVIESYFNAFSLNFNVLSTFENIWALKLFCQSLQTSELKSPFNFIQKFWQSGWAIIGVPERCQPYWTPYWQPCWIQANWHLVVRFGSCEIQTSAMLAAILISRRPSCPPSWILAFTLDLITFWLKMISEIRECLFWLKTRSLVLCRIPFYAFCIKIAQFVGPFTGFELRQLSFLSKSLWYKSELWHYLAWCLHFKIN